MAAACKSALQINAARSSRVLDRAPRAASPAPRARRRFEPRPLPSPQGQALRRILALVICIVIGWPLRLGAGLELRNGNLDSPGHHQLGLLLQKRLLEVCARVFVCRAVDRPVVGAWPRALDLLLDARDNGKQECPHEQRRALNARGDAERESVIVFIGEVSAQRRTAAPSELRNGLERLPACTPLLLKRGE